MYISQLRLQRKSGFTAAGAIITMLILLIILTIRGISIIIYR